MAYAKAMADRELTVKEICDIVDLTLRQITGKGLGEIGVAVRKDEKTGKTKIELVV